MSQKAKNTLKILGRYSLVGVLFIVLAFSLIVVPFFTSKTTALASLNRTQDIEVLDSETLSFTSTSGVFEVSVDTVFNGSLPYYYFDFLIQNDNNVSYVRLRFQFFVFSGNIHFELGTVEYDTVSGVQTQNNYSIGVCPYTQNNNGYRRISISFRRNKSQLIGFVKFNDQFVGRTPSTDTLDNIFRFISRESSTSFLVFRDSSLKKINLTEIPDYLSVSLYRSYVSYDVNLQSWHNHNQLSYDNGFIDGANQTNTAVIGVFPAIIGSIVGFFTTIGSYEIMGISLLGILISVGALLLVVAVLKVFLK